MNEDNLEDIYELSPMQQGMLFHLQKEPASNAYFEQFTGTLKGTLHADAFLEAWQSVIDRHTALRTAFFSDGMDEPMQVVLKSAPISFQVLDWSAESLSPDALESKLETLLAEDRAQGFTLDEAPLMRVQLIRIDAQTTHLVWSFSHLLLDGWCLGLLFNEIVKHYESVLNGQSISLTPARPYRDFINWLAERPSEKSQPIWSQYLNGFERTTTLPFENKNHPTDPQFAEQNRLLSAELTQSLEAFANQQQVTLNTLTKAIWALVLGKSTGQTDLVFGTTVSGRPTDLPHSESIIGMFINTIPCRVQLAQATSITNFLQTLQSTQFKMSAHEHCSLTDIHQWSPLSANQPLFESLVVFENYPANPNEAENSNFSLQVENLHARERTNFPLTLVIAPAKECALRFIYDTNHWTDGAIENLLNWIERTAKLITESNNSKITELNILPEAELATIQSWNTPNPALSAASTPELIHDLVAERAQSQPEAISVQQDTRKMTYRALDERSNQLAQHLRQIGVQAEDFVAISLNRSIETCVAQLAVLKAGAAFLPIDPSYPSSRIDYMLENAACRVLINDRLTAENSTAFTGTQIRLSPESELWQTPATAPQQPAINPKQAAYCIYTSGSTGQPKGVVVTHANLLNLCAWHNTAFDVNPSSRATHLAGSGFDASAWEIWPYLAAGASVYPISKDRASDVFNLPSYFQSEGITHTFLPTALLEALIHQTWPEDSSLSYVLTGGDRLNHSPTQALPFKLINNYGPTEATVVTTSGPVSKTEDGVPTIGKTITQSQVWILGQDLNILPIGVIGELYIGGQSIARGYLNSSDLTAAQFIPNPFSQEPGARLYRTGDLARYLPNGEIEFIGRRDHQIQLRGFRIELSEIEAQILQSGLCSQTIVKYCKSPDGVAYLAAYLCGNQPDIEALTEYLEQQLPNYMVPTQWVEVDAFPLSANGKIDRKALPDPAKNSCSPANRKRSAQSPLQEVIKSIFASVLQKNRINLDENFFHLGGHSLLAMQAISRLRESLGYEVPLQALFDAPTIASLSSWIDAEQTNAATHQRTAVQALAKRETFPLSFSQERLWVLSQMPTETDPYHITLALRLTGSVDSKALAASLNQLIRRHEALRTAFISDQGKPLQKILHNECVPLDTRDLSDLSPSEANRTLTEFVHKEAQKPFFLQNGTLLRATLLKVTELETALVFTVHHIVADGWSIAVLARDWLACYNSALTGNDPELPELSIQYGDYAHWQRNWLQGDVLAQQLDYWTERLRDTPVLELPTDHRRPTRMTHMGRTEVFTLPAELTQSLKQFGQNENATLSMTLLAAYSLLLQKLSRQNDFTIGMPIANREGPETENLIGFFVNTLVIRNQYSEEMTFSELLAQVRQRSLEAYTHRDIPFEKLLETLNPERNLSQSPLFQVMFTYQNTPELESEVTDLAMAAYPIDSGTAKFDITLTMLEKDDTLLGSLEYNRDLFETATIQRFVEQLTHILSIITECAEVPLATLPLLPQTELNRLAAFNQTATSYPPVSCLPHFLEEQTRKTPTAAALQFQDTILSYQDFNQHSNRLAHYLQTHGVQAEDRVAVFLERSIDLVSALHGIVKAGAAYVPIDPDYPAARIAYMLSDCRPTHILTLAKHQSELTTASAPVICLDTIGDELALCSDENPTPQTNPENLAYIIYTSGSTGQPKGAMNTHRGIYNRLQWMQAAIPLDHTDRVLQKTPFSFDVSVWEFFWPFINGACLVIAEPQKHKDSRYLAELIEKTDISTLHFVPSMFKVFLNQLAEKECPSLKHIICSGEALSYDIQAASLALIPQAALHNLYGPTEAAVDVTHWPAQALRDDNKVPIGQAIANTTIHIVDEHLNPTPLGVHGELCIGGIQLARGYWDRAALTAEKFIPNPFSQEPGACMYRTGDSARYLDNGDIEYIGRLDFQVKIRGFRIELGEIETAIKAYGGIQDAVVIASQDSHGYDRLVAYVIPSAGHALDIKALHSHLSQQLPEYMLPAASAFVRLDSFPISANGKLDRKALPEPGAADRAQKSYVAPRNSIEAVMAHIWSDVLKTDQIGAFSNFFELGGHSLLATQILSRVREIFRIEVSIITLFEAPQIATFTEKVVQQAENPEFLEKISTAWMKLQSMPPEEKEKLRQKNKL